MISSGRRALVTASRGLRASPLVVQKRFITPATSHVKDVKSQKEIENLRENSFETYQLWTLENWGVWAFLGSFVLICLWAKEQIGTRRVDAYTHALRLREQGTDLEYMRADEEEAELRAAKQ